MSSKFNISKEVDEKLDQYSIDERAEIVEILIKLFKIDPHEDDLDYILPVLKEVEPPIGIEIIENLFHIYKHTKLVSNTAEALLICANFHDDLALKVSQLIRKIAEIIKDSTGVLVPGTLIKRFGYLYAKQYCEELLLIVQSKKKKATIIELLRKIYQLVFLGRSMRNAQMVYHLLQVGRGTLNFTSVQRAEKCIITFNKRFTRLNKKNKLKLTNTIGQCLGEIAIKTKSAEDIKNASETLELFSGRTALTIAEKLRDLTLYPHPEIIIKNALSALQKHHKSDKNALQAIRVIYNKAQKDFVKLENSRS